MAPTIHSNQRDNRNKRSSRRQGLVCQLKYSNTLPEVPFDPKPITYPFDINRFVQYNPTSLERGYKFDLHTEHDLGIPIDLVDPEAYNIDPNAQLAPEDEYLLEDESTTSLDSKRSQSHRKNVSWLRKTEYISTEYRMAQGTNKHEAKVGYHLMKKKISDEVLYKDRDSQVKAINSTFEDAAQPITEHYSKPHVTPVEIMPIFPDFEMWKHPCAQVIFDSDPSPPGMSMQEQMELMSQAIICGEQFVSYFLPTPETLQKRKRDADYGIDYEENEEYDYLMTREYNWTIKNKSSRDYIENYFFVTRDGVIYYNELETRVRLNKRRKLGGASQTEHKTRLLVKHRPLTSEEVATQEARSSILEPMVDEDEEMDFAAHEEEDKADESDQDINKNDNEDEASDKESEHNDKEDEEEEEDREKKPADDNDAKEENEGTWEKGGGSEDEEDDDEDERDKEKELIFGSESSEDSD